MEWQAGALALHIGYQVEAKPVQLSVIGYWARRGTTETSLLNEGQLAHEREVIRRQTRERRAMDAQLGGMQGGVHENVIDREQRKRVLFLLGTNHFLD